MAMWGGVELVARYGIQMLVFLLLARLLSPGEFGLLSIAMVFVSLGLILSDSGFGAALVQLPDVTEDHRVSALLASFACGSIAGAMLWAAAPWLSRSFGEPGLLFLVRWLSLALPLGSLVAVPDGFLVRALRFQRRAAIEIGASLAAGAGAVLLAARGRGLWSLIVFTLGTMALRVLGLWMFSGWRPRGRVRRSAIRDLVGFGGFLALSSLLDTLSTRLHALILGWKFDSGTVGRFSLAQNVQQVPTFLATRLIDRTGLPVLSEIATDRSALRRAIRHWNATAQFLFMPCMLLLSIGAKDLVAILLGPDWSETGPVLAILALAALFAPVSAINLAALKAMGHARRFLKLEIVKKSILIVAIVAGSGFGAIGVAWAFALASAVALVANLRYSDRWLGYGLAPQLRHLGRIVLLNALAGGGAKLASELAESPLSRLTVSAGLFFALYLGGTAWQGVPWNRRHDERDFLLGIDMSDGGPS